MSFVADQRHYTVSSTSAAVSDLSLSTFGFDFPYLNYPQPPSAAYQTIAVESFEMLNCLYTVELGVNDRLAVNFLYINIPAGFYTITQLCATLQGLVRPVIGNAATVTYSYQTGRMTIASNGANFSVLSAPATTCGALLGMATGLTYSGFATYTFPNLCDLQPTKRVILTSNLATKSRDVGMNMSFLGSFSVNAAPFALITFTQSSFESTIDWNQSLSTLIITVCDQDARPLPVRSSWSLVLSHTIYHKPELIQYTGDLASYAKLLTNVETDNDDDGSPDEDAEALN
jgi:hypothetical protein